MKAKLIFLPVSLLLLAGCDYCPQPGVLEFTNQFYTPRPNKYPIPRTTGCAVEPGPGILGKPASVPNPSLEVVPAP